MAQASTAVFVASSRIGLTPHASPRSLALTSDREGNHRVVILHPKASGLRPRERRAWIRRIRACWAGWGAARAARHHSGQRLRQPGNPRCCGAGHRRWWPGVEHHSTGSDAATGLARHGCRAMWHGGRAQSAHGPVGRCLSCHRRSRWHHLGGLSCLVAQAPASAARGMRRLVGVSAEQSARRAQELPHPSLVHSGRARAAASRASPRTGALALPMPIGDLAPQARCPAAPTTTATPADSEAVGAIGARRALRQQRPTMSPPARVFRHSWQRLRHPGA